jgi:voltage-gated potassium channel
MEIVKAVKKRIVEIIDPPSLNSKCSKIFAAFIVSLILLNVAAVILGTVESFAVSYHRLLLRFEIFSVVVFTIEYLLRLWVCTEKEGFASPIFGRIRFALTPLALIDLIAVLPFYLPFIFRADLRFVRIIRLFRIARLFKIGRYSQALSMFVYVLKKKKEELGITVVAVFFLLIIASSLMYYVEHDTQPAAFSSIPAAMWWGITTLTTVGYGDICPATPLGKFLGAIIALAGIGVFALPTGILASGFASEIHRKEQKFCPHCRKPIE